MRQAESQSHLGLSAPRAQTPTQARACDKCTRSKRRCDKTYPQCGRCQRLRVECWYKDSSPDPSSLSGELSLHQQGRFSSPANAQHFERAEALQNDPNLIKVLLEMHKIDWQAGVSRFFVTVHNWFRILSQEDFENDALPRLEDSRLMSKEVEHGDTSEILETALLISCMCMLSDKVEEPQRNSPIFGPIYQATRRAFSAHACITEYFSLSLAQCGALLALFEFGHGRSRYAYRTLSETVGLARLADVRLPVRQDFMGVSPEDTGLDGDKASIWWGLFVLDQYIHLSLDAKELPLIVESPREGSILPVEGIVWGIHDYTNFRAVVTIEEAVTTPLGSFQRSAQAARLLHETHLWNFKVRTSATFPPLAQIAHVDQGIRDLTAAMLGQCHRWEVFCDALSMSIGAIFNLYCPYLEHLNKLNTQAQNVPAEDDVQRATTGLQFGIGFLHELAKSFNEHLEQNPGWLANLAPPANLACFLALQHLHAMPQIFEDTKAPSQEILQSLVTFSRKWALGENMLENLESLISLDISGTLE